jgi:DNA-binding protein HU-beta
MNNSELIDAVAEKAVLTKAAVKHTVDVVFEVITDELAAGNDVRIHGFGTFHPHERKPYMGHNPQTGEKISVVAKRSAKLTMGKALTGALNPPARKPARRRA